MFEELREIDTTAIDELGQIKQEQEVLEDRLARMEAEKEQVSEAVYDRVRRDYAARSQALEDQARPLKAQARGEYRKLGTLAEGLAKALETARLDKEELELRHRLGEFDDDAFQERLGVSDKQLEEREGELREVEELEQRFVGAFRSREELREPSEEAPAEAVASAAETAAPEPPAAPRAPENEAAQAAAAGESEPAPAEPPGAKEAQPTTDVPEGAAAPDAAPSSLVPPPGAAPVDLGAAQAGDSEATVFLKGPRLVVQRGESTEEIALELDPVTIGRAVKNTVRFFSTSVSRHHARVSLSTKGYVIADLGSGNGTLVNGEAITGERQLSDGDTIQVGSEFLVFRDR